MAQLFLVDFMRVGCEDRSGLKGGSRPLDCIQCFTRREIGACWRRLYKKGVCPVHLWAAKVDIHFVELLGKPLAV